MATLNTLKLTDAKKPKALAPIVHRRNKLIDKLWEQLQLARAKQAGNEYAPLKDKRVKDVDGITRSIQVPNRIKPWWFTADNGKLCLSIYYGAKTLELAKGKSAAEVANMDEVIDVLELLKVETAAGTFDAAIETASGALRSNFKQAV